MTPPLFIAVPPSTIFLSPIRGMVTSWLGLRNLKADRWCLVVTELVTNAMSVTDADSPVTIRLRVDGADVELTVTDGGPGLEIEPIALPDPSAPRGRGLLIVDALTTGLTSQREQDRTVISCRRAAADDLLDPPPTAEPVNRLDSAGAGAAATSQPNGSGPVGPPDHTIADSGDGSRSPAAGQR